MVKQSAEHNIVITGIGWVTPLGDDVLCAWNSLMLGKDAFVEIPSRHKLRNNLCAVVPEISYDLPVTDRLLYMTVTAAEKALHNACLDRCDKKIVSVIGTSFADCLDNRSKQETLFASLASQTKQALQLYRSPIFVSTACSSGSDALAVGFDLLCAGAAEVCLCGGIDVLTELKRLGHSSLGTMSPTRLRAFDKRHDGTLLGEGAAFVVIERRETHADSPILGRILGYGAANDAASMAAPSSDATGGRLAVKRALDLSGITQDEVAAFCAHGSGTVLNDETEKAILNDIFSSNQELKVFATKGSLGHSLGATGAIQAIALLMALRTGMAPPIAGLEEKDPAIIPAVVNGQSAELKGNIGLSLTLGFGGFNTCLAVTA